MAEKTYSQRLGVITNDQFQAALDHFKLGVFVKAEPIPFGIFGQNVFVTSSQGDFVLRGQPHFWWQFPMEQFYVEQLHERTQVPVPWPYLIDPASDIFGWSYVIMPRMPGLQVTDPGVQSQLGPEDKRGIARALGENLALMHDLVWPFSGRYNAFTSRVEPFELASELAWPFTVTSNPQLASLQPTIIPYSQRVIACIRQHLANAQQCNASTTTIDIAWTEGLIAEAKDALNDSFQPSLLMEDYKEENLVVTKGNDKWRVSGVFDFMQAHFGDGEADLSRPIAEYLAKDTQLAREFAQTYLHKKPPRPGFAKRFPVYMLLDRAILWAFFQRHGQRWWDEKWTFRDWASQYTSVDAIL